MWFPHPHRLTGPHEGRSIAEGRLASTVERGCGCLEIVPPGGARGEDVNSASNVPPAVDARPSQDG